jgi:hypothetical protein
MRSRASDPPNRRPVVMDAAAPSRRPGTNRANRTSNLPVGAQPLGGLRQRQAGDEWQPDDLTLGVWRLGVYPCYLVAVFG